MVTSAQYEQQKKAALATATPQDIASAYQKAGVSQPVQTPTTPVNTGFSASRQAIQDKANWLPVKWATPTYAANTATGVYKAPDVTKLTTNTLIPWAVKSTKIDTTKVNPATYKYWQDAIAWGINQQQRNLELWAWAAGAGLKDAASIQAELEKSASYKAMDEASRVRTAQDVFQKMWEYQQSQTQPEATTPETPTVWGKPWYFMKDWVETAILWYGDLDPETQKLVDQMSDADKKMLDMKRGNDIQGKAEYLRQAKRSQEYLNQQRDYTIQITDLNWQVQDIQASQRLRDAGKQVDNLIQNVNYLGQMWAPWVSSTHLQAQKWAIADAEKKFAELKQIESNLAQIRALDIKVDTAAFEKQMADISDDLNMKVGMQIQNALNDMTAADMAGQLDTVDWVTQFKRSLLERLDNNISGYTQGSMQQMQYVTEQYTKIADDAQARIQEWTKNSNTVNTEMSTAKGFMVDGNGTPLYNAAGETIKVPAKPPMDPVFDKASGKLITFADDGAGGIKASVQQVMSPEEANWPQVQDIKQPDGTVVSMTWDKKQQKYVPVTAPAIPTWATVTPEIMSSAVQSLNSSEYAVWTKLARGECWEFANDWLKSKLWYTGNLITNTWAEKQAIKNSDIATPWSIAIITSKAHPDNGHVGIVMWVNADWSVHIKESNRWGDKTIHERDIPASDIYGYFDATKVWAQQAWSEYAPLFKKYVDSWTIPAKAVLSSMGMDAATFAKKASSYQFSTNATPEQQQTTQDIYDKLIELEKMPWLEWAVGASFQKNLLPWMFKWEWWFIPWSNAANFASSFETFKNTQVLPNLWQLKWPMSDKDVMFLKSTATSLNLDMDETTFKAKLAEIKKKLEEKLGISEWTQTTQWWSTSDPLGLWI